MSANSHLPESNNCHPRQETHLTTRASCLISPAGTHFQSPVLVLHTEPSIREVEASRSCRLSFLELPETHKGHWGTGSIAEDMKKWIWVRPELVAQIEYLEWTESDHLGHSKYMALRGDKDARKVSKNMLAKADKSTAPHNSQPLKR
jgi:hypothetical protein